MLDEWSEQWGAAVLNNLWAHDDQGKYRYNTGHHRRWRDQVHVESGHACEVCGARFVGPRGGKLRRGHAHHVRGTEYAYGASLCSSCHSLLTTMSKRKEVYRGDTLARLLWFVAARNGEVDADPS